ncbi:MAG: YidB family protein, partial [Pyrinomonadaceae bacterium]|nr:YidB family protein [Pyrinomonadaceae bacterium]
GGKSGTLLAALLALMTDKNRGGLAGFLENFNRAGLGDTAASWVGSGSNTPVSNEQLKSALGEATLADIAGQAGTDHETAASATAYLTPRVIDALTPSGVIPPEKDLLSNIGGYLTGFSSAASDSTGAAGATAGETFDRIGSAADDASNTNKEVFGDRTGNDLNSAADIDDDNSILKWLIPLLLLGLLIVLGYAFCGKSAPVVTGTNTNVNFNANANAAK